MAEKYFELFRSENKYFTGKKISITGLHDGTSIILIATNHKQPINSLDCELIVLNKEEMISMAKTIFDHFGLSYIPEISSQIVL